MWNLEYWALESWILLKETRIQLRIAIRIQVPLTNTEVLVIRNAPHGIQNLWMSWIPLQGAKRWKTILNYNSSFSVLFFFSFETHQQRLWHASLIHNKTTSTVLWQGSGTDWSDFAVSKMNWWISMMMAFEKELLITPFLGALSPPSGS